MPPAPSRCERPFTDNEYWESEITRMLTQEEFVRSEMIHHVTERLNDVKATFKMIVINDANLTFIDMAAPERYRREKPIKELRSAKFKPFKALLPAVQARIAASIDTILSKRRDAEDRLDHDEIDHFTSLIVLNLEKRQQKKKITNAVIKRMNEICGVYPYPFDDKYHFRISVDPMDVLMKSTGQTWSTVSCESIHGGHKEGPFDDVSLYNAVVFLEDNSGKPIGRLMIRWCNPDTNKKGIDIGIESSVYGGLNNKAYLKNLADRRVLLVPGLYGYDVYRGLYTVLKDHGFLGYGECTTPYDYKGWSDMMQGSDEQIIYHKLDYPLKYAGEPATKLVVLMESSDGDKSRAMIEDWRRPIAQREISEADIIQLVNSMDHESLLTTVNEGPINLIRVIISLEPFNIMDEIDASSDAMEAFMEMRGSPRGDLAVLIFKGYNGRAVFADEFSVEYLVDTLYATKEMGWYITTKNHGYMARAALAWFLDVNSKTCPGRMESGVGCVALQVLMRTYRNTRITLSERVIDDLLTTNKVTVIGALLAYMEVVKSTTYVPNDVQIKYSGSFNRAAEKYADLYAYSQIIIDEWFKQSHDVTVECGECYIDEQTGEEKRFTITEKSTGKSMKITLCSRCASKIFIVYCDDEKKYARRLRLIHWFYAKDNFAPESFCETTGGTKYDSKTGMGRADQARLEKIAFTYLKSKGHVEKYTIEYMGKIKKKK